MTVGPRLAQSGTKTMSPSTFLRVSFQPSPKAVPSNVLTSGLPSILNWERSSLKVLVRLATVSTVHVFLLDAGEKVERQKEGEVVELVGGLVRECKLVTGELIGSSDIECEAVDARGARRADVAGPLVGGLVEGQAYLMRRLRLGQR